MADNAAARQPMHPPSLRKATIRHPIAAFLVLLYAITGGLALVPVLTGPTPLPNAGNLFDPIINTVGCAGSAFVVTAIAGGREALRDLARRCLRWRVRLRWYAAALLGMPAVTLVSASAFYGISPVLALGENWPLLFSSYLPTLALMIVLYNVTEEFGFTGFLFARLQDRHGPMRAMLLTTVFFWAWHLPTFVMEAGSWATAALVMGIVLLPHAGSRVIVGWLYNASGASALIAGLFHATFNSTINPGGFAIAVLEIPSDEAFVILMAIVVIVGAFVAVATKGRLGLPRSAAVPRE